MSESVAEEVVRAAAFMVSMAESHETCRLDYSRASLDNLEQLAAEAADHVSDMSADRVNVLVESFGCYILEVARREFGGRFLWHDQQNQPVLVAGEPAFRVALITWNKVRGRLGGDAADNIPFFYAGFAERARHAAPGTDVLYV